MTDGFYMVWNPSGYNPTHKHESRSDAEKEAERLARLNPGAEFFVLLAVSKLIRADVQKVYLKEPDEEMPF